MDDVPGEVVSANRSADHGPRKGRRESIRLLAGLGVEGDAHLGERVQHLSRKRKHPGWANLRQVHLIGVELLERLAEDGFELAPGDMGENVTTRGVDLLGLSRGTRLRIGNQAVIELTGLRNPCKQLDGLERGLMAATLARDEDGGLVRLAGVMAVVIASGEVRPGDPIQVAAQAEAFVPLEPV